MQKSKIYWYFLPVIFVAGILIGNEIHSYISSIKNPDPNDKIDQVLRYTVNNYYKEVDTNSLIENAINGLLEDLDPHSIYIPRDDQIGISEQFRGNYDGIGIEFQIINDTITVVTAMPGGPGESVGILPGDRIVEINNISAIGYNNADVVSNLRGSKGSSVELKIYRPYLSEILDFVVIRDQVPLNTVDVSLMIDDSVGYIALTKFVETSIYEMKNALDHLSKSGMKRLILDLRNNPGGYLDQAVSIADLFIKDEKLIVYTKGRKPKFDSEYFAGTPYEYENIPLAVLVNRGSASSSEIFTGAIKDWDRGIIVGERTFGKGLVQRPFTLADGSVVRITISKYYTPSGNEIQRDFENEADYFGVIYANEKPDTSAKNNSDKVDDSEQKGGILPDFVVYNPERSYYTAMLRSRDIIFKFTRKYLDNNRSRIDSAYKGDLKIFSREFSLSEDDMNGFVEFASKNGVNYMREEFNKDKEYIAGLIKAYIAKDIWNNKGWYTVNLKSDSQFLTALEQIQK